MSVCERFLSLSLSLPVSLHPSLTLTPPSPPLSKTKWPDGFQSYMLIHNTQTAAPTHLPREHGSALDGATAFKKKRTTRGPNYTSTNRPQHRPDRTTAARLIRTSTDGGPLVRAARPAIAFQEAQLAGCEPSAGSVSAAFVGRGEVREAACVGLHQPLENEGKPGATRQRPCRHTGRCVGVEKMNGLSIKFGSMVVLNKKVQEMDDRWRRHGSRGDDNIKKQTGQ